MLQPDDIARLTAQRYLDFKEVLGKRLEAARRLYENDKDCMRESLEKEARAREERARAASELPAGVSALYLQNVAFDEWNAILSIIPACGKAGVLAYSFDYGVSSIYLDTDAVFLGKRRNLESLKKRVARIGINENGYLARRLKAEGEGFPALASLARSIANTGLSGFDESYYVRSDLDCNVIRGLNKFFKSGKESMEDSGENKKLNRERVVSTVRTFRDIAYDAGLSDFVLVGGAAAVLQGRRTGTEDLDIEINHRDDFHRLEEYLKSERNTFKGAALSYLKNQIDFIAYSTPEANKAGLGGSERGRGPEKAFFEIYYRRRTERTRQSMNTEMPLEGGILRLRKAELIAPKYSITGPVASRNDILDFFGIEM